MRLFLSLSIFVLACSQGAKVNPRRSNTYAQLCKDYLNKGALEAAEHECHESIKHDPSNWEPHHALGMVLFLRHLKNFELLEIAECTTGVDAEVLRKQMAKQLDEAEAHFASATRADPEAAEAWAMRGVVATRRGDCQEAIGHLREALAFPSRLIEVGLVRAHLGWAHFHCKNYVEAATSLRQALQFKPKMCVAGYRLGRVYFARKEWDKAEARFREVALNPTCRNRQEAYLYWMKSQTAKKVTIDPALRMACVRRAPKSCVAARCRTLR